MKRNLPILFIFTLALVLSGVSSFAQSAGSVRNKYAPDSTKLSLTLDPKAEIVQGKTFDAKLHFKLKKWWHIYTMKSGENASVPLKIAIPDELKKNYQIVSVTETGPTQSHEDPDLHETTIAHYNDFDAIVKVKVRPGAPVGKNDFFLWVFYQACDTNVCIPPSTYTVPRFFLGEKALAIDIKKGDGTEDKSDTLAQAAVTPAKHTDSVTATATPAAPTNEVTAEGLNKIANTSLWEFIITAIGFGLLSLVTPCVFPMIPITVSFFTKRNQGSKRHAVRDAVFYAVGIISTFVILGFVLAIFMGPAGINKFAANPLVNALVAIVFVSFALNLFGLFELGVPSSVLSKLNMRAAKSQNKITSVILMGFVFSLTSFTCTVPFVGTLMVSFSRGEWFVPLVGMTVFASVFALPFFLLALFPSAMKALPKSGGWLNSVKVVMGFLEIAAALKFISNMDLVYKWGVFTHDFVLAAWVAIMGITAMYLLGRFHLPHDTPSQHIGPIRAVFAVIFLTFGIYLFTGLGGKSLGQIDGLLPPMLDNTATSAGFLAPAATAQNMPTSLSWLPRYSEALAEAKKTGKNIFIDFTGYQCTNCRAMESTIFKQKEVTDLFKQYVLARLYADDGSPLDDSNRDMEESRFSTIAQPYYAIVSPDDKTLATFPGYTKDLDAFLAFLKPHASANTKPAVAELH